MNKRFWLEDEKRWITLRVSARGMRLIDKLGLPAVSRSCAPAARSSDRGSALRCERPRLLVLLVRAARARAPPSGRCGRSRVDGRASRGARCAASPATASSLFAAIIGGRDDRDRGAHAATRRVACRARRYRRPARTPATRPGRALAARAIAGDAARRARRRSSSALDAATGAERWQLPIDATEWA